MTAASLELCKELYELSGWHTVEEEVEIPEGAMWTPAQHYSEEDGKFYPAYDLGFLLRKLPARIEVEGKGYYLLLGANGAGGWASGYELSESVYDLEADTPEDAVCKLAIELFEQGVLKKDES